jgi:hypothetical protein
MSCRLFLHWLSLAFKKLPIDTRVLFGNLRFTWPPQIAVGLENKKSVRLTAEGGRPSCHHPFHPPTPPAPPPHPTPPPGLLQFFHHTNILFEIDWGFRRKPLPSENRNFRWAAKTLSFRKPLGALHEISIPPIIDLPPAL